RDGIGNADESFLRNVAAASAGKRKNACAHKREPEAEPVSTSPVRIHPDQDGSGSAQGGNLCQSQVHENDAAFHHVYPEIGVNTSQNQAGQKRRQQEWKDFHVAPLFSRVKSFDQQSNIVVEKLKIICHLFLTAYGR